MITSSVRGGADARRAAILHSTDYPTLAALFTARNAISGPAVVVFSPLSTHTGANLRIDQPDTVIQGNGATITLPAGADQDCFLVGVNAIRLRIENLNLAGNYTNQTGTSRGIVFEEYTGGGFRFADRSAIVDCNIDGFLHDGVVVKPERKNIILDRTFVRDYGRYGLDLDGPDCRAIACNFGGVRGLYGVRINNSTAWVSQCGIYSNNTAGLLLTRYAQATKLINTDIDNNYGGGLRIVGVANDGMRVTVQGCHFRSNSQSATGTFPDIYLEQCSLVSLIGNSFYNENGSTWQVSYAIDAGAGVTSIQDLGNSHESAHTATARYSPTAQAAMVTRTQRLDLSDVGVNDTSLTRSAGSTTLSINSEVRSNGTVLTGQATAPGVAGANLVRLFSRNNGAGRMQLCVIFPSGVAQVLATEV